MKVMSQQILDAGLNVFGLHLFLESVAARFKPKPGGRDTEPLEFEVEHRGTRSTVRLWLKVTLDEEARGDDVLVLRPSGRSGGSREVSRMLKAVKAEAAETDREVPRAVAGDTYGHLEVVEELPVRAADSTRRWRCRCLRPRGGFARGDLTVKTARKLPANRPHVCRDCSGEGICAGRHRHSRASRGRSAGRGRQALAS